MHTLILLHNNLEIMLQFMYIDICRTKHCDLEYSVDTAFTHLSHNHTLIEAALLYKSDSEF